MSQINTEPEHELIKEGFNSMDRDNKGYVQKEDLYQFLKSNGENISPEECHEAFQFLDTNNSGKVTLDEFKLAMNETMAGFK